MNGGRDCEHGRLARSCEICDLNLALDAVTAERDAALAVVTAVEQWGEHTPRRVARAMAEYRSSSANKEIEP